jgi:hypothetical protein
VLGSRHKPCAARNMTGPKHRQVLIYFLGCYHPPVTLALPCEGNGNVNFMGNTHLLNGEARRDVQYSTLIPDVVCGCRRTQAPAPFASRTT